MNIQRLNERLEYTMWCIEHETNDLNADKYILEVLNDMYDALEHGSTRKHAMQEIDKDLLQTLKARYKRFRTHVSSIFWIMSEIEKLNKAS